MSNKTFNEFSFINGFDESEIEVVVEELVTFYDESKDSEKLRDLKSLQKTVTQCLELSGQCKNNIVQLLSLLTNNTGAANTTTTYLVDTLSGLQVLYTLNRVLVKKQLEQFIIDAKRNFNKVLFLASNPANTAKLNLEEEHSKLARALQNVECTLYAEWVTDLQNLSTTILKSKPRIIHFSGHGGSSTSDPLVPNTRQVGSISDKSGIFLEKDENTGEAILVPTDKLESVFGLCKSKINQLNLVILNACRSVEQAKAISKNNIYVIGMTEAIEDTDAIAFSKSLYEFLVENNFEVEETFELVKATSQISDKFKPELYFNGERVDQ